MSFTYVVQKEANITAIVVVVDLSVYYYYC